MKHATFLTTLLVLSIQYQQSNAATLAVTSDFEGGNREGWRHPAPSANQTTLLADGPSNTVLRVTSSGAGGPGSRLVVPNMTSDWIGNYIAAGITAVTMDLRNTSGFTLSMRLGIEGAPGNRWTSTNAVTLLPGVSGTYRFELNSSALSAAGGSDLNAALTNVTQIRILHNANAGDFRGENVEGEFTLDNITLAPEPSSTTMGALGMIFVLLKRRR